MSTLFDLFSAELDRLFANQPKVKRHDFSWFFEELRDLEDEYCHARNIPEPTESEKSSLFANLLRVKMNLDPIFDSINNAARGRGYSTWRKNDEATLSTHRSVRARRSSAVAPAPGSL